MLSLYTSYSWRVVVAEVGTERIRCMKPVPGLGEKWPPGKTCVCERPAKRVASKLEDWVVVVVVVVLARMEALGSLKCAMYPYDDGLGKT